MTKRRNWFIDEAKKIGAALAQTFAPLCEVVVHDLTNPKHSIVYIGNNFSGRKVGDPATELGLARSADANYPDVLANYANSFPDGRQAKSTSIGLRDESGKYVAAICVNVDLSYLRGISHYFEILTRIQPAPGVRETLNGQPRQSLETKIFNFSAQRNRDPRSLNSDEKRTLIRHLAQDGDLEIRGAAERIGSLIGLSRSNVYYYLKDGQDPGTR
jgi:predicted transcriptional regulator YheO